MQSSQQHRLPNRIEPYNSTEFLVNWTTGECFAVPYLEVRYLCPCAVCVDEKTGKRILQRESIPTDIRPVDVSLVGRYAIQISWSDRHATGMYHFDRLFEICKSAGRSLNH